MTLFERVKELCQQRGVTLQTLAEKTNLSVNSLYKWKTSMPSADKLEVVANYFDVSTDYLLGRENTKNTPTEVKDLFKGKMSFDGKPISDHDKLVAKQLLDAYFENKKD